MTERYTPEQLMKDLDSSYVVVRRHAAGHPDATPQVLLKALGDWHVDVRFKAANNPNATPEALLKAMGDKEGDVRLAAARHPNATPKVLLKALRDRDVWVRRMAARNPNIKKLDIPIEKWLELVAGGAFIGSTKNIPARVKRDPRYKGMVLLRKLSPK